MMEVLPFRIPVILHVPLVISYLAVAQGPVKVMGAGVIMSLCVIEVGFTKDIGKI